MARSCGSPSSRSNITLTRVYLHSYLRRPAVKLSAVSARPDTRQFSVLGQGAKGPVVLEIKVEDKKAIKMQTVDLTNGPAEAISSAVQTEDYTFFTTSRADTVYWFKKGTTAVKSHTVKVSATVLFCAR